MRDVLALPTVRYTVNVWNVSQSTWTKISPFIA